MLQGALLIDKPPGVTSHDVVQVVRTKLSLQRVGHTGTLDPMAQGLLIALIGPATKHQQAFQGHDKTYEATVRLGAQTDTADATGTVVRTAPVPAIEMARLTGLLQALEGSLTQVPPAYSAVKVRGRPSYWWARRQQPVTLHAREVQIHALTALEHSGESIRFRVHCSSGTYVRSLAETIAERLGTVGHLTQLTRTEIGAWTLASAVPLIWVREATPEAIAARLIPVAQPMSARA